MSTYIDIVTGTYGATRDLVFVPASIDEQTQAQWEEIADGASDSEIIDFGIQHGFALDPFAPLIASSIDHPRYGTTVGLYASDEDLEADVDGLLDNDEVVGEEGLLQHLIDEHGCIVNVIEQADPRLHRVSSTKTTPVPASASIAEDLTDQIESAMREVDSDEGNWPTGEMVEAIVSVVRSASVQSQPTTELTSEDPLDAVSVALAALEHADLSGLDADIINDIRKAVSSLENAEQSLTPQDEE